MHAYPWDYIISERADPRLAQSFPLGSSGLHISVGPYLPVRRIGNAFLLGNAFGNRHDEWAGRWLLISEASVTIDAGGLIACYYDGKSVSSNPKLMTEAAPSDPVALRAGFVIPPESGYKGISKLLPSQVLQLPGTPIRRDITWPAQRNYSDTLQTIAAKYQSAIRALHAEHPNIWTGLTSGRDSRLILSVAHAAGIRVKTYTNLKPWPFIPRADREIPPLLANAVGLEHRLIRSRGLNKQALAGYHSHLDHFIVEPGSSPFYGAYGYYDGFTQDAVLLNGLCGELGRFYYSYTFDYKSHGDMSVDDIQRVAPVTAGNRRGAERLAEWFSETPLPIDSMERLYWEAYIGGYASNTCRLSDFAFQGKFSFGMPLLNCLSTYGDILSIDASKRINSQYIKDLISLMMPQTDAFPINPRLSRTRYFLMRAGRALMKPYYRTLAK